ncbi:hypothetical protein NUW54_g13958 [Trametes sanguinea]|uniref:Uncharacterized protein n=1 Tax=Trametes sanguinea TaxID=158606 RepID=A0ACC1MGV8_9APHY|nr:hypothetical protein NUW54_g13958 [Trametes sanguinea]
MSPHATTNGVHANGTNGVHNTLETSGASRPLTPGIYAPIPTFFDSDTEELDLESFTTHVVRVAKAGVGPLLAGSMGEAHHLTHYERVSLIKSAREGGREGEADAYAWAYVEAGRAERHVEAVGPPVPTTKCDGMPILHPGHTH